MNVASTNYIKRAETLNVAVSTDTILYTPFFLAYYSNDFSDTPFGGISVNIIGKREDARFKENEKLKGDGFATFCLLFGLADAAICDPSYLVYLQSEKADITAEFKSFEELLNQDEKDALSEDKRYKDILNFDKTSNKLEIESIKKFKELFEDKKVIGGLVKKIAFSVAGEKSLADKINLDSYKNENEKFGRHHSKKLSNRPTERKEFTKDNVDGLFIYYKSPSTGNCVGEIHASIYKKKKDNKVKIVDFGLELDEILNGNNKNSIAITCDFVSLDFYRKFDNRVIEIEDLAADDNNYLFTGVLGNQEIKNIPKLQALLYGIDKNLYLINKFLKASDTTGLTRFLKSKFNYAENKEEELLELLVADSRCRKEIKDKIDDKENGTFTFDSIILYFVKRLLKWKKHGNLYYNETTPSFQDFKKIIELRYEAKELALIGDDKINKLIEKDILRDWRRKERAFFNYENNINILRLEEKKGDVLILLLTPFLLLKGSWRKMLRNKLWLYINKPSYLYTVGSLFIIFEILSSMCHIFSYHIPKMYLPYPDFIPLSLIPFTYVNITVIILIIWSRNLLKLKENDKYVYRDEQ